MEKHQNKMTRRKDAIMNDKKITRKIEGIVLFLLLALLMIINESTEIRLDIEWVKDVDVWINDFFVNTFVFFFMSTLLYKIKNELLNFGISYVVSALIGNCIHLDSSNFAATPKLIILIVLDVSMLILWGWRGYSKGTRRGQKDAIIAQREYFQTILQMDNETRSRLYNLNRFIRKHPKECATIDKYGIDFVIQFIQDDKKIRKAAKGVQREIPSEKKF